MASTTMPEGFTARTLPVLGWPARKIFTAMCETRTANASLAVLIPIDVRGMVLDTNPGSYYW